MAFAHHWRGIVINLGKLESQRDLTGFELINIK